MQVLKGQEGSKGCAIFSAKKGRKEGKEKRGDDASLLMWGSCFDTIATATAAAAGRTGLQNLSKTLSLLLETQIEQI